MDQEKTLGTVKALQDTLEKADLQLLRNASELNSHNLGSDEGSDLEDHEPKDPAIIAADVATQISFLRKLKFQYLEQNAKDKYVKSIVSDIDDAPIVTAEDNKELQSINEEKKKKLRVAKASLAETQHNIRTLAPLVEQDYQKLRKSTEQVTILAQKIIDARLALSRLRQIHPHPRLTIPLADQKLIDQVTEMQNLNDELSLVKKEVQAVKERVKGGGLEVENLRVERADAEKTVKSSRMDDDEGRLAPLYDWYTASLGLHRSVHVVHNSYSASENELRLAYNIGSPPRQITISLIFAPDTRHLAAVQLTGAEEMDIDVGEVIDTHVQVNDVHGVVAAILARVRAAV